MKDGVKLDPLAPFGIPVVEKKLNTIISVFVPPLCSMVHQSIAL